MSMLNGSVGAAGLNDVRDVAIVQILLMNVKGAKQYYKGYASGLIDKNLSEGIKRFQLDNGLINYKTQNKDIGTVRPSGTTFKVLKASVPSDFHDLKVQVVGRFYPVFFIRKQPLNAAVKVPNLIDMRLPDLMASRVQGFMKKTFAEFFIQKWDITDVGEFCLTLATNEKFYDATQNKIITGPSQSYYNYILKNLSIKEWEITFQPNRTLVLTSKKIRFFAAPHTLSVQDVARLKHWNIPRSGKGNVDGYQKKLLSAAVRPWRKVKKSKDKDFYEVPQGLIPPSHRQYALLASQALNYYGDYSGIKPVYNEIFRRTGAVAKKQALILLYASAEFQFILGISLRVGLVFDPSTQKEYLFVKASLSLSAAVGGGISAGIETDHRSIEELFATQGISFGSSFSNELSLGPVAVRFEFRSGRTKAPDIYWNGVRDIPLLSIEGAPQGNFLSLAGDTVTGERLAGGEESTLEKAKREREEAEDAKRAKSPKKKGDFLRAAGRKAKRKANEAEYSIMRVDFGSVVIDVVAKPKLSGKIRLELGPEVHGDYFFIKDVDMDYGWFEDQIYTLLRAFLPEPKPLFPLSEK